MTQRHLSKDESPRSVLSRRLVATRARLPEAPVGHDVRRDIEGRLDRDLEGMLDEPLLPDVMAQDGGTGKTPEVGHARFDQRQFLGEQLGVGHRAASRGAR